VHIQNDRGVNATIVECLGVSAEVVHDIALHIAFARPQYLTRDEVPAEVVERERETLTALTRNEGKPEAALPKIVEGRLNGFFKERCLVEQEFAKDNKQTIKGLVGSGSITRFAQVEIG
jgi:elongation factor Ts